MRLPASNALLGIALMAASSRMLSGQGASDRRFLDSIITAAHSAATETAVPALSRCDGRDPDVVRICQVAITVYHSPLAGKREEVFAAEDLAVRTVFEHDRWPYAWFALGLVRLQLAHDRVLPHEGPALPPGMSNELGGANALIQALELDPGFAAAANALAMAPEPREGVDVLGPRVIMLRRVRSLLTPAASVSAAMIERDAGSVDSAVALEQRALAQGAIDSGTVLLALARDLYRVNRPSEGRAALIQGAATATDAGIRAYRAQLAWVATPAELGQWDSLTPRQRPSWLAGFWAGRDAAEGRPDGDRLVEHYRRVEYAMAHFRIPVPETDRSAVLTFLQSNDYLAEQQGLDFATHHSTLCPETARFATDSRLYGADSPERYFQPRQDLLDDRGTVWIRHGPPTRSRQSNGVEAAEIWRYERADSPLVVQFRAAAFRGTTGVSVLVPSLLTVAPGVRNQICALEITICSRLGVSGPIQPGDTVLVQPPLIQSSGDDASCRMCPPRIDPTTHRLVRNLPTPNGFRAIAKANERCQDPIARILERDMNAEGTLLGTAAIIRARDRGREQIDIATTTDSYHRDFNKLIHPALQVLGLDRAQGGMPRVVVAFSLSPDELDYVRQDSSAARGGYPVRVQIMAANTGTGRRTDVDTTLAFPSESPLGHGHPLTGLMELPLPPGQYAVGVVFSQAGGRGGEAAARGVRVPVVARQLAASELVLGRSGSGVRWNSGATSVALNPAGTYPRGGSTEVYFQLSGLTAGHTYQTRFEFYRVDDESSHPPRLTLSFTQTAPQDRVEVTRTLGLRNLDAGRYRVKLTVAAEGMETTSTGWLVIEK